MRRDLDHLRPRYQRELEKIVAVLREEFGAAVAGGTSDWKRNAAIQRIVLFGSFATGRFVDENIGNGYKSDYDLLVVVNGERLTDPELWYKAEDRLMGDPSIGREANFIVHTLADVNDKIAMGQYFFADIAKEGVVLHELKGTKPFGTPQSLTPAEALETAQGHFERWSERSNQARRAFQLTYEDDLILEAVFNLHQATERLYTCALLVLTNYSPNTHNIKGLRSLAESNAAPLIDAWPRDSRAARRTFELLKRAYVEARYSKHYAITAEELAWLGERVDMLSGLVKTVCEARIGELAKAV